MSIHGTRLMAGETHISDVFYKKLVQIVETNLEIEDFGVHELVEEVGLSRSQIHRKLKSITGQSISRFIREIRLKRAHELLKDQTGNVSEIAYQVGFSSPTYFNKCFRDYFGYAPGSVNQLEFKPKEQKPNIIRINILFPLLVVGLLLVTTLFRLDFWKSTSQGQDGAGSKIMLTTSEKSIAVLPFKDDSQGGDNQYFCDGIMDEVLNHLQKIAELEVKSRTAVEPYKNSILGFSTIARELDVAFILEGAVRKDRDRFRVTIQLIDVASGNHVWSDAYEGILSDTIFIIQSSIAKKVASSLNAVITPDEEFRITRIPTTDIRAYDLRIRASHEQQIFWQTRDIKHLKMAHELLDRALQIDPNYKRAILGKGEVYIGKNNYDSALIYADRLIVLDPDFIGGYGLKGDCYFFKRDNDRAIENYQKAIDLIPNSDDQWLWYHVALGRAYTAKNDVINALPHLRIGLDMGVDYLPAVYFTMAISYIHVGDYKSADEYLKKNLELKTSCAAIMMYNWLMLVQGKFQEALNFSISRCQQVECERECSKGLYQTYWLLEDFENAEEYFYQWKNFNPADPYFDYHQYEIGYLYYQMGRKEESKKIFAEEIINLESKLGKDWSYTYLCLARIHSFQGDTRKAIKYLSGYAKYGFDDGWHDFILIDPYFDNIRNDPEFKAIVQQAQGEKAALRAQIRKIEKLGEWK